MHQRRSRLRDKLTDIGMEHLVGVASNENGYVVLINRRSQSVHYHILRNIALEMRILRASGLDCDLYCMMMDTGLGIEAALAISIKESE